MRRVVRIFSLSAALAFAGCLNIKAPTTPPPPAAWPCIGRVHHGLPDVVSVPKSDCPYALCLDSVNLAKLKKKLAILESQ